MVEPAVVIVLVAGRGRGRHPMRVQATARSHGPACWPLARPEYRAPQSSGYVAQAAFDVTSSSQPSSLGHPFASA
jgi:hypothetical protein